MLKYLYVKELFTEVPGEITLGISISGCTIRCPGCHSRELWEDKGEPLDVEALCGLLNQHNGITCLCLFGGEHNIDALTELFMYAHKRVKTAWYCGLDMIPKDKLGILDHLDYCKIGHYDQDLGGLDSPTTNQKLYQKAPMAINPINSHPLKGWLDITSKFWKHDRSDKVSQA